MTPPCSFFISLCLLSLFVSLSCAALFLTVLLTSCTRGQDQLWQWPFLSTDPILVILPQWESASELPKNSPEKCEGAPDVNKLSSVGSESRIEENARPQRRSARALKGEVEWPVRKVLGALKGSLSQDAPSSSGTVMLQRSKTMQAGAKQPEKFREGYLENGVSEEEWSEVRGGRSSKDPLIRCASQGSKEPSKGTGQRAARNEKRGDMDVKRYVQTDGERFEPSGSESKRIGDSQTVGGPAPVQKPRLFKPSPARSRGAAASRKTQTLNLAAERPRLLDLKPSHGHLEPAFDTSIDNYALHVESDVEEITITPVLAPGENDVRVYIEGERVANNTPSKPISVPKNSQHGLAVPVILKRGDGAPQAIYVIKIFRDVEEIGWRLRLFAAIGLGVVLIAATTFLTYSAYMWDKLRRDQLHAYETVPGSDDNGVVPLSD